MDEISQRLAQCAASGNNSNVRHYLAKGAKINSADKDGNRPLHLAAKYGKDGTVVLLIAEGAKLNLGNRLGETPLFSAVAAGHIKVIKTLIERGADVFAPNNEGELPYDRAVANGLAEITEILQDAMREQQKALVRLPAAEVQKRRANLERVAGMLDAELQRRQSRSGRTR